MIILDRSIYSDSYLYNSLAYYPSSSSLLTGITWVGGTLVLKSNIDGPVLENRPPEFELVKPLNILEDEPKLNKDLGFSYSVLFSIEACFYFYYWD